jgi:hypothetical protein
MLNDIVTPLGRPYLADFNRNIPLYTSAKFLLQFECQPEGTGLTDK